MEKKQVSVQGSLSTNIYCDKLKEISCLNVSVGRYLPTLSIWQIICYFLNLFTAISLRDFMEPQATIKQIEDTKFDPFNYIQEHGIQTKSKAYDLRLVLKSFEAGYAKATFFVHLTLALVVWKMCKGNSQIICHIPFCKYCYTIVWEASFSDSEKRLSLHINICSYVIRSFQNFLGTNFNLQFLWGVEGGLKLFLIKFTHERLVGAI